MAKYPAAHPTVSAKPGEHVKLPHMTIASFLFRRRRMLVLCAASIALHLLTIDWVGAHLGTVSTAAPSTAAPSSAPPALVASLRLALPVPESVTGVEPLQSPPQPAPARPVSRAARKLSRAAAPPAASEPEPLAGVADGAWAAPPDDAVQAPPEPPAPAPAPAQAQAAASGAAQAEAAPLASPAPRRYKVNLPPSATFALDVTRVDADGSTWHGAGVMAWRLDGGGNYSLSVEAGLDLLVTRVNLLVLNSEGKLDDSGIAPVTATEKRKGRPLTATHFKRDEERITFSASERSYPLLAGAQDKASLPFQLAGIGRADVNQFQGNIDVFVGEDKEANIFRFSLVGEDELDTKMGRLVTWHLSRPPKPGTYSSRLDIWLAPSRGWYPVQIRNTEANGAVTTQSVSNVTVTASSGR